MKPDASTGEFVLRKRDGASVRFQLDTDAITTEILDPSGTRVVSVAAGPRDETMLMLRPPMSAAGGWRQWVSLQAGKDGSGMFFGSGDRTTIELKQSNGASVLTMGDVEKGPCASITAAGERGCSVMLKNPKGSPNVFLQDTPATGSILSLGVEKGEGPRVTFGVNAEGEPATKVISRDGRVIFDLKDAK
jgi:hypothetical protein